MAEYTHLHLHTEYSLLDGANKIKNLAKKAKEYGMKSIAMTDHGNMFGAIDFYKTMKAAGIKPVIGMEAYVHNAEKVDDKSSRQRFHLCLYAKNDVGYKNLMYLSSQSYLHGFYYYPRITKKLLKEHSEGIICSSACLQGEVNWALNTNNERNVKNGAKGYEQALETARWYKDVFGDDFYLEIMRHGIMDQYHIDDQIIKIGKELDIRILASNDTHYLTQDDAESHEVFMCIAMNKLFDDPKRIKHSVHEFFFKSADEIAKLYEDIPEALEASMEIADKCNLEIKLGDPTPPNFKFALQHMSENGVSVIEDKEYSLENDKALFIHLCKKGLEKRLEIVDEDKYQEYRDRLDVEIKIINSMKFPGYMLIVWEFVNYAKKQGIPVGPGRGSAAGSLVAYSLEITDIDPMPYGLLFERFLNPERVSMPDIDMDFCQARRGEVIEYVRDQYGRDNVAQIITFGKLLAKGVIRDVARVLDMPYSRADAMAKLIPDELGINLEKSLAKEPKIQELIDSDPQAKRVWEFAERLEGLNRNAGTHAAGVVISNEPLWEKTPLFKPTGSDIIATQYSGKYVEDVDLIKFDFLGLKTLTVIDEANKLVAIKTGAKLNFATIDVNDKKVYEEIQTGHTVGLFQIESSGMQDLAKRLKPTNFEDIIAMLALYRPGPMESGMLDDFIDRKHGRAEITYMFPELAEILEPTYGVIVYQEQVMQIVQTIGGFSLGGADLVRRAMGKKIKEEMDKLKVQFCVGAGKKGFDESIAADLFDLIVKFAGYGFNKSHSAAYAMVTFQTSYLKAYFPAEFMAALLTSEKDNTDKVVRYVDEVKRMGMELLPPNVNKSLLVFSVHGKTILFGMGAIKGAGDVAINTIIKSKEDGDFKDMSDFVSRIEAGKVNKKVIEVLIKSGALDDFGYSRKALLSQVETITTTAANAAKLAGNLGLFAEEEDFGKIEIQLENMPEYDQKEILEMEKESLGFYVSGHPLDRFREELSQLNYTLSSEINELADGSGALFVGKIEEIKEKISKKGNKFAIATLMDLHGNIELMLFEKHLKLIEEKFDIEEPIVFKVKISKTEQFTRMNIMKIESLKEAKREKVKVVKEAIKYDDLHVKIDISDDENVLEEFFELTRKYRGGRKLILTITTKLQDIKLVTNNLVSDELVKNIDSRLVRVA